MMFLLCYQNLVLVSLTYVNKIFSIPVVIKAAFRQAHQNHSRGKNGMRKTSPDGRAKTSRPRAFAERLRKIRKKACYACGFVIS